MRTLSPPRSGSFKAKCRNSQEAAWEMLSHLVKRRNLVVKQAVLSHLTYQQETPLCLSPCFTVHMASPIFYHGSMFGESIPCLLTIPFISKFLHKCLFIPGRNKCICIIDSSLAMISLLLSSTLILLYTCVSFTSRTHRAITVQCRLLPQQKHY